VVKISAAAPAAITNCPAGTSPTVCDSMIAITSVGAAAATWPPMPNRWWRTPTRHIRPDQFSMPTEIRDIRQTSPPVAGRTIRSCLLTASATPRNNRAVASLCAIDTDFVRSPLRTAS
jgi:hypothetical protein